jgi:predicted RNA binding protein YcfA (HicA-like mRNA interferase family)
VARDQKLLLRILSGTSDANVGFDELRRLLRHIGFEERVKGSHHIFVRGGVEELVTLQRSGAQAKPYQVRQVRKIIVRYGLGGDG